MNDQPEATQYQIMLQRHLGPALVAHFPEFSVENRADGNTLLCGQIRDQAALHGVLTRIHNLGLTLIAVTRVEAPTSALPIIE